MGLYHVDGKWKKSIPRRSRKFCRDEPVQVVNRTGHHGLPFVTLMPARPDLIDHRKKENSPCSPHRSTHRTMAVIQSTASSAKSVRNENALARVVGSGSAGILELAFFHPVQPQLVRR